MFGMWLRVRLTNINQASGVGAVAAAARSGGAAGGPLQRQQLGVYRRCSCLNARSSVASVDCGPAQSRAAEKGPTLVLLATSPAPPHKNEDSTPVSNFISYDSIILSSPLRNYCTPVPPNFCLELLINY